MVIPSWVKVHGFYLSILGIALFAGKMWLSEHDGRIKAELENKQSQAIVQTLQGQIKQNTQAANDKVKQLQTRAKDVKTPEQAIAAIPDVSVLPLNTRPIPGNVTQAAVDIVPLFQELEKCKETSILYDSCQLNYQDQVKINIQKDFQISNYKKIDSFSSRMKVAIVGAAIGVLVALAAKH